VVVRLEGEKEMVVDFARGTTTTTTTTGTSTTTHAVREVRRCDTVPQ